MKHSKVKQSDIDKTASAVVFDDTTSEEIFGALRQPMPKTKEVDMSDMWSVLDDVRFLEQTVNDKDYPRPEDVDRCLEGMRKKLCSALGISEEEYEYRFKEGDLPF